MRLLSLHNFLERRLALELAAAGELLRGRLAYWAHLAGLQCSLVGTLTIIIFHGVIFIKAEVFLYLEAFLNRVNSVYNFGFYFLFPWAQLFCAFLAHLYLRLRVLLYEVFAFLPRVEVYFFHLLLLPLCVVDHIFLIGVIIIRI